MSQKKKKIYNAVRTTYSWNNLGQVCSPINVIKCNMQNSFKVIGGLDDEPYCRLISETEIDRVNIKLRKQMTRDLQNVQPVYQLVFHCSL